MQIPGMPTAASVKLRFLDGALSAYVNLSRCEPELDCAWLAELGVASLELVLPPGELLLRNVASLTSVSALTLRGNEVHGLSWLSNLSTLRRVTIDANVPEKDWETISSLTEINSLTLGRRLECHGRELPISNMLQLTEFRIDSFYSGSIDPLMITANLESLSFSGGSRIATIFALQQLPNLRHLAVPDAGINEIDPLARIPSLRSLDISRNSVSRPTPIPRDLELLTARDNFIEELNVEWLADAYCELRHADLSNNLLTSLSFMSRCPAIEHLNMSENFLADISKIQDATRLRHLDVSGNCLTQLPDLTRLTALRSLNVARNPLVSVDSACLPNQCEQLDLSETPIDDTQVAALAQMPSLRSINVSKTNLTCHGAQRLKAAMPNCRVTAPW